MLLILISYTRYVKYILTIKSVVTNIKHTISNIQKHDFNLFFYPFLHLVTFYFRIQENFVLNVFDRLMDL